MKAEQYYIHSAKTEQKYGEDSRQWNIFPLGIVGELGTLASVVKKHIRDKDAYIDYKHDLIEEESDILWYTFAVARRFDIPISKWPTKQSTSTSIEASIFQLSSLVPKIVDYNKNNKKPDLHSSDELITLIENVLIELAYISNSVSSSLDEVANKSIQKTKSFWTGDISTPARCFDEEYKDYERLPREFVIEFIEIENEVKNSNGEKEKGNNELIVRMNDVQLGDRLTDNSWEIDGYRYHDIFHMAGSALLGWSPVFRRMLKKKRKSIKEVDEKEDGARAAVIEEALVSQVYDYGEFHNFSSELQSIDINIIKNICRMVRNYEAKVIEPWEWKHYMLSSYSLFRQIREGFSGKIKFDAEERKISIIENYSNL